LTARIIFLFWTFAVSVWPQNRFSAENQMKQLPGVPPDKFTFAVVGDRTGAGPDSWSVFDRAVSEMNLLRPDFCILIGDLIEGRSDRQVVLAQWQEAVQHLDSIRVPVFLIPGNHDISDQQSYALWNERLGRPYGSMDIRGCHFLMLDTEEVQGSGEFGFGAKQLSFAEQDILKNQNTRHFFVFLHQPVWTNSGIFKTQWARLESILPKTRVTVVAGHLHALAMKKQNGRTYLILGPTGGTLRLERSPALGLFQHFTWFTVESGQCSVAFIEPGRIVSEGTALDAYDRYLKGLLLIKGQLPNP